MSAALWLATLLLVVAFIVYGWLVVRRPRGTDGSSPPAATRDPDRGRRVL